MSVALKTHLGLIVIFAIAAAMSVFYLPETDLFALPASKPIIALATVGIAAFYGVIGWFGYMLARSIGFAETWSREVSNVQRFCVPALTGFAIGIVLIVIDSIIAHYTHNSFDHPEFPLSILASFAAGIGEEILFRLVMLPVIMWVMLLIFRKKRNLTFWIAATISSIAFAGGHIPATMMLLDVQQVSDIPTATLGFLLVGNCLVAFPAAVFFRKYGFLAAVGVHFWTDIVWHVVWGAL